MATDRLGQLKQFYKKFRRLPSYSEMLKLFKISSKKAVFDIVHRWIDEGLLKMVNNKLAPSERFFALPLYGLIKAGFPIMAEENKEYLSLDEYLIKDPISSFLLRVSGDSLINIGIFDGDIVIIEKRKEFYPGDVVLAEIDKEWTLKIYKKDIVSRKAYLDAANPKYPSLHPQNELTIHGIVRAVIRKLVN